MRRIPVIVLTMLVLAASLRGQPKIDNPKRPLAKNAGRLVYLDEVLRIRDDGKTAIFGNAQKLTLGRDGSLLFLDYAGGGRLYRYGPDGELIFKALQKGQGPGECQHPIDFFFAGDVVRVISWIPPKVLDLDFNNGRCLREIKVEEDSHGLWFLGVADGKIYGIRDELFSSAAFGNAGVFPIPNSVYEISPDFKTWRKLYEFPVRMVTGKGRAARLDMIDASLRGSTLYILHTAEYRVVQFDLRTGRVERIITRAYDRVRSALAKGDVQDPEERGLDIPSDRYMFDVFEIHAIGENLWVLTSTRKPDGDDQQVDVFDAAGRYVDSFLLRFPAGGRNHIRARRKALITDDGYFFIPEEEEDGLVSIGKYRIRDPAGERK